MEESDIRFHIVKILEEHPDGSALRDPGDGGWIEGLHLGPVVEDEVGWLKPGAAGGEDRRPEDARQ